MSEQLKIANTETAPNATGRVAEPDKGTEPAKTADFETMLVQLEKIVSQLEGELKLEEALALFEQGLSISQDCEQFLKHAEKKIEVLRRTAQGIQVDSVDESEFLAAQS